MDNRSIQINRIRCDGHGLCAGVFPEMIRLDDWGYPIIQSGAIPAELLDHAKLAVKICPVQALRLAVAPPPRRPPEPRAAIPRKL